MSYSLHVVQGKLVVEPPLEQGSGNCLLVQHDEKKLLALHTETRSTALSSSFSRAIPFHAILGFVKLLRGYYLGIVTRAELIVRRGPAGADIYRVLSADFIPVPGGKGDLSPTEEKLETRFLGMLHSIIDQQSLYYSHNYDITQTMQRIALLNGKSCPYVRRDKSGLWQSGKGQGGSVKKAEELPMSVNQIGDTKTKFRFKSERADPRFFWNSHMVQQFEDSGLENWIHPMMCGYVEVQHGVNIMDSSGSEISNGLHASYIFISRRSRDRQGMRFVRRGVDNEGNVANFVETEQILLVNALKNSSRSDVAAVSFVQTRGSIPLCWTQNVTVKYMPRVNIIGSPQESLVGFKAHFLSGGQHTLDNYGRATCVNLIDREGTSSTVQDQRSLGQTYESLVGRVADERLRYVWFDFHHECRRMRYDNLSKLMNQLHDDLHNFGAFVQLRNGEVEQWQSGVIRTNCMDNLDRTNVVQSIIARYALVEAIARLVGMNKAKVTAAHSDVLQSPLGDFERVFLEAWRNNANTMSVLYSGTPALKTRLGYLGKLQDGVNSVTRFVLNNFFDGNKQDAIDLFLGNYKVNEQTGAQERLFARDPKDATIEAVLLRVAFMFLGVFLLLSLALTFEDPQQSLRYSFWVTCTLNFVAISHALRKGLGRKYVDKPKLVS